MPPFSFLRITPVSLDKPLVTLSQARVDTIMYPPNYLYQSV